MCSRHALRPSKVSPHLHVYFAFFGLSKPSVEASWHCGVTFGISAAAAKACRSRPIALGAKL